MKAKIILTTITVMTVLMHLINAQTNIPNDLEVNGYINSTTKEFRFANEMQLHTTLTRYYHKK